MNESLDINYYETAFRNYDAQIGRFTGIDAFAGKYTGITPYQFGFNNPIYYNDPSGALSQAEWNTILSILFNSPDGGTWSASGGGGGGGGSVSYGGGTLSLFGSSDEAFISGAIQMGQNGWYGANPGWATSFSQAWGEYNGRHVTTGIVQGYYNYYWKGDFSNGLGVSTAYENGVDGFNLFYTPVNDNSSGNSYNHFVSQSEVKTGLMALMDAYSSPTGEASAWSTANNVMEVTDNTFMLSLETGFAAARNIQPGVEIFRQGVKIAENGSRILGGIGVGLTILDAANDPRGWQTKHSIDFSMGIIGTVFSPIGVCWFGANLINMAINDGKTISESIQDSIDNSITF